MYHKREVFMKISKYIKSVSLIVLSAGILTTSTVCLEQVSAEPAAAPAKPAAQTTAQATVTATPLAIVNSPSTYLNKNVKNKYHINKRKSF